MNEASKGKPVLERIVVTSLPDPMLSNHPHCVVTGDLVFVSGLVSERRSDGSRVGVEDRQEGRVHDLEAQMSSIFQQLDVILEAAGSNKAHIADVQVFLLRMADNFTLMNEIYGAYFGATVPARTTIEVVRFPSDVLIELKVVASVEKRTRV
jgi:2-iminobutanoate/2-iminopropanoate deaminase